MKHLKILSILAGLCFARAALATDYYVNPIGNDAWTGTLKTPTAKLTDGPFKTLERAKAAIRTLKKTNTFTSKVTVNIASGIYYLNAPLNFNLTDSGLLDREILWQGEPGAKVTISAGLPITCKKRNATFWDCPLTKLPVNKVFPDESRIRGNAPKFELYVNEQKMELARWPDQGWAHIKLPLTSNTQFTVMETLPALTGNVSAAQVHIFGSNDWFDQYLGITAVNKRANALALSSPPLFALASGRRFHLQNLPALLNAPGEWIYQATTKKVSFVPPAGIAPTAIMLSSLPNILIADGINYVSFKNISFQHSAGTAIIIRNSSNIIMEQLDVNNVGSKGVEINAGKNVQLLNSKIHHTGAHGVVVNGGDKNTLQASGHVIHNNYIHHMGTIILTYSSGIEINGVGATVTHNLLEQGAGTAILLTGNDHLIEKNEVHHFCLQASDCGAIYSGRNWSWRGNIIRYNYIHDIISYGMKSVDVAKNQVVYSTGGAVGVYLDDGASGFEVNSNIFENAGSEAILIGGGRDNKITNNFIKTGEFAIWIDHRWPSYDWEQMQKNLETTPYKTSIWKQKYPELAAPMHNKTWPEGNRIERNVIVTTNSVNEFLRYTVPMDYTAITNNLIWSTVNKLNVNYEVLELKKVLWGASWAQWIAERVEQGSLVADPCVTIKNKQMITCPNSPLKDIGFKPLPTDIGLLP